MNREKEIFEQALDLDSSEERVAFIKGACRGDAVMRERLMSLLQASEGAGSFLPAAPKAVATVKLDPAADHDQALGSRIGHYKLLQNIGEGGCGIVYMAEQEEPVRRRVALKIIKLGMDTKAVVARFEAERQALAMMDHPNIAKVLDAGTTEGPVTAGVLPAMEGGVLPPGPGREPRDTSAFPIPESPRATLGATAGQRPSSTVSAGRPYFVMELVRGIRITDYCDQNHLSTRARLELFMSVCQAVQHAHQKGIIHRDLKPSNILVTLHDGVPVPKVIDFGIAKAIEQKLTDKTLFTELHQFIGTPAYMSPEQAEMSGLDIDTRSDIYSLGVLLYELLTGRTPFDTGEMLKDGIDAMRRTIREREPLRPSTRLSTLTHADLDTVARARGTGALHLRSQLRGDLDWIVMKCLEKDRARRYETANGVAADLRRHLNHEPVIARPPSALYRVQKAFRRNKLACAAISAVLAMLLVGTAVSTWQAFRAMQAEQEQHKLREVAVRALDGEKVQRAQAEAERRRAESNAETATASAIQSRRSQYAADMFSATAEIEKGSYGNARKFLREYLPRERLEELRGFEWRHLWQTSAGQQLNAFPVNGQVIDLAWSPDGRWLAAGCSDRTVKLLEAATGELKGTFTNHSDFNVSVAFSHDGHGLATAGSSGLTRFWDLRDGRLRFSLTNYTFPRLACSPASPLMAVGTGGDWWGQRGSNVYLVDLLSGKEVRMLPNAGDRAVFSRDGKRLATANDTPFYPKQSVKLWDVASGEALQVLGNQRQVLGMAFSSDGGFLATGSRLGEVVLWNLHDLTRSILREATGDYARSVMFSPDGRWLAVAMLTQEVEIWDVNQRRLVQRLRGHTGDVNAVAYSPDGLQLASGSADGTIRFWDPRPPVVEKLLMDVRLSPRGYPTFSPDSRWLAAPMHNGELHIVDATSSAWNTRTILPKAGLPLVLSRDGATLSTLNIESNSVTVRRWNAMSKVLRSTTVLETTNIAWLHSATTPDGNLLALARFLVVEIFDTRTGRRLDRLERPPGYADSIELSRDGRFLALGMNNTCVLRDVVEQRIVWTGRGHRDRVFGVRFSPDQKTIATASWDSTARLWDARTGKELAVLAGHRAGLLNCAFSPDGRTLATKSDDRSIKFWNLATFREVGSIQMAYAGEVPGPFLAFSPDGQMLAAHDSGPGLRCFRVPPLAEIDAAEIPGKPASEPP